MSIPAPVPSEFVALGTFEIMSLALLGMVAGILGGLLGLGGSVVMIPGLALLLSRHPSADQHLFQASAMIVNVIVSLPAAVRHHRAGHVPMDLVRWLLPATTAAMILGVLASNALSGEALRRCFAAFLVFVAASTIWSIFVNREDHAPQHARVTPARGIGIGLATGTLGGLLGIGGGLLAVPMIQRLCKLPIRQAISASSSVMVVSSALGAAFKVGTIESHAHSWKGPFLLAACMAPTALVGGHIGAGLTHKAPLQVIRAIFGLTALAVALRLADVF